MTNVSTNVSVSKLSKFLSKKNKIAIIGASNNKEKWGYKIFITLKQEGYNVYPVNPKHSKIDGDICYKALSDLPFVPDFIITVVTPKITEKIVLEAHKLGAKKIWMQPGSESEKAIELCEKYGIEEIHKMCFVVDGLKIDFVI